MSTTKTTLRLLDQDRSFQELLVPFFTPYLVYVSISSIPHSLLSVEIGQGIKLLATAAALLVFRKFYRFGPFKLLHGGIALLALPVALLSWIVPFYLLNFLGIIDVIHSDNSATFSFLYFCIRIVNSVFLVAIFEEIFMRVYVLTVLYQAGFKYQSNGLIGSILDTLEQKPTIGATLPLSRFSVIGAVIVFSSGHRAFEYLSAILYFLFTTWIYKKSGSLWVCILIHGLTNLSIALLARYGGLAWLW
jgi:membrane protease YdiL (CAAX protease family)